MWFRFGDFGQSAKTANFLHGLVAAVRAFYGEETPSCIAATANIGDACRHLGLEVQVVPVSLIAAPPAYLRFFRKHRRVPTEPEASSLGLHAATTEIDSATGWGGHLIAIVRKRWIVDATLDFANTEVSALTLTPIVSRKGTDLLRRGRTLAVINECLVLYQCDMKNQRFRQTLAWRDVELRRRALASVIDALAKDIACASFLAKLQGKAKRPPSPPR